MYGIYNITNGFWLFDDAGRIIHYSDQLVAAAHLSNLLKFETFGASDSPAKSELEVRQFV